MVKKKKWIEPINTSLYDSAILFTPHLLGKPQKWVMCAFLSKRLQFKAAKVMYYYYQLLTSLRLFSFFFFFMFSLFIFPHVFVWWRRRQVINRQNIIHNNEFFGLFISVYSSPFSFVMSSVCSVFTSFNHSFRMLVVFFPKNNNNELTRSRTSSNHSQFSHHKFSVGLYTKPEKVIELIIAIRMRAWVLWYEEQWASSKRFKRKNLFLWFIWSFVLSLCPSNFAIVCLIVRSIQKIIPVLDTTLKRFLAIFRGNNSFFCVVSHPCIFDMALWCSSYFFSYKNSSLFWRRMLLNLSQETGIDMCLCACVCVRNG